MRRQIAIPGPELRQPASEQLEVVGLLGGDTDPFIEKLARQSRAGESGDEIPSEVDRVELDMGKGVEECCAACQRAEGATLRHLLGRTEQ
jgi:hypothetical protein